MKKLLLLLLAAAAATSVAAQPDTLTVNKDYYPQKRNVEELVPVTRKNIVMLGNSLTERGFCRNTSRQSACSTAASAATASRV